ncbi:retrovirus-related pol polyprotein from transposon TNT 1-94, partial [Tanacetum coccineum]
MYLSNPLYVHPFDGPGTLPIQEKLVGAQNYRPWRRSMEIGLSTKRKLIFVKGTIPKLVVMPVTPENTVARAANAVNIEIKNAGKEKCSICGFKWNPQDKCWEKVKYHIWHHKYKAQGKQNQSRSKEFEKGRGNGGNLNQRKTAANVTSGSNSFTFTSEQFENLIRNVLKDMRPGATAGDCTNDEIEFVAGMICLNAATNNAFFHWIIGTGASDHMTPFCRDMINAKILEVLPKINLLNGDSSKITQIGQVNLKMAFYLRMFYLRTRKVHGLGRKIDGLYHLLNVFVDQVDAQLRNEGNCVNTATYLINRIPSSVLQNKAPYEMLLKKVPDYSNLRVFGCFAVAANPSRVVDKFAPRGVPCVFLDYPAHKKGYKSYNLLTHNSFVSRDVVFHEHIFPFDESSSQKFFQQMPVSMPNHTHPVVYDDCELEPIQPVPTPSTIVNTKILVRRSTRTSKAPNWTKDFVAPTIKPAANQQDPKRFKEAVKDVGWCEAMNAELRALEEN